RCPGHRRRRRADARAGRSRAWESEGRGWRPEIRCVWKAIAPAPAPFGLAAKRRRLGRQLLAAARAAGGENLAAADGRLAGAEAVTALAHEAARLIGALHRGIPKFSSIGATKKGRQARAAADRG